jgi:plasmid stabilization system protein ParE
LKRPILLEEAKADLEEAVSYLEAEKRGLGKGAFLAEFHKTLGLIREHPLAARKIFEDFRKRKVHNFKYDIVYVLDSNVVVVYAVMHQRRDPDYWKGRI